MPIVIPQGFAQVTIPLRNVALSRPAAIVFGVAMEGVIAQPNTIADTVQAVFENEMCPQLDSGVIVGPTLVRARPGPGEPLSGIAATATSGDVDGQTPPPNVAIMIRKQSLQGGRGGRGRMFMPWWCPESAIDEAGVISGPALGSLQTAADDFLTGLIDAELPMQILHNDDTISGNTVPAGVTGLSVDGRVSSMKKRLGRR